MAAPQPPAPSIVVQGNVDGSIVSGDNNFVVNTNYGTIVYKQSAPGVSARTMAPKPPRKPKSFIGRAKELAQLEKWIAGSEPVLLSGQPGLGKTTLAKQATNGSAALAQPSGVVFIESPDENGKILSFDDIVQLMFDALFESDPPLKVNVASARTYLSNAHPLVYLNGVNLTSADLDNLSSLFPSTPILIETEQLESDDDYDALPLGPFVRNDSLALLADRSSLALDQKSQPAFDEIANILGDVPGALVIIGNALKENRLKLEDVPSGLKAIDLDTKLPVKAALSRAYRLVLSTLSADERAMLIETGSAPGISVDRKWLERGNLGDVISQKLESLQLLYANSPRLRLNSGLREIIMQGQDDVASKEKLLQHLEAQLQTKWNDFDFVRAELGNLLGLFDWAMSQRRWQDVVTLGRALDPFLTLSGLWDAWHRMLIGVRQAAAALGDIAAESWALHQIGTSEIGSGNFAAVRQSLEHALKLRQKLGDNIGAAYSQHNLDILLSAVSTSVKPRRVGSGQLIWLIGGGIVLLVLAALVASYAFGLPMSFLQHPTATPSLTSTATFTLTPPSTLTFTPSVTSSPAATPTFTSSPTYTATIIPTYSILSGTVLETSACFYGPGTMYLQVTGVRPKSTWQIIGMNQNAHGPWLYLTTFNMKVPCWVNAKIMQVNGDINSLEPAYPNKSPLPHSPVYSAPSGVIAVRSGNQVTVSWDFTTPVPLGMRESADSPYWLVELWTCQSGQIVFTPIGAFDSTVVATDEPGCSQPSHGRIYFSDVDGYDGPTEIHWPQP